MGLWDFYAERELRQMLQGEETKELLLPLPPPHTVLQSERRREEAPLTPAVRLNMWSLPAFTSTDTKTAEEDTHSGLMLFKALHQTRHTRYNTIQKQCLCNIHSDRSQRHTRVL